MSVESARFRAVTDELEGVSLFGEQSWIEARDSDVSCAIAIAVDRLWDPPVSAAVCDLVLSLLWVWACRGEAVASMTLEVLKARPHLAELARSRDGKMRALGKLAGAVDGEPAPTSL